MTATVDLAAREAAPRAPSELELRLLATRAEMERRDLAALLLVSPENLYYLLGLDYQGYFAFSLLLLPREGQPVLVTRAMEAPTIRARVPGCRHLPFHDGQDPVTIVAEAIRSTALSGTAVGVEDTAMFFPPAIWARLRAELPGLEWVSAGDIPQRLREIKSAAELTHVRRAAALSTSAMNAGIATIAPGAPQPRVAAAVYHAMISQGSQQPGFAPLIRPTAILQQEHVTWDDEVVSAGDGLFLELSAAVRRYHAPLSRTLYVERAPAEATIAHDAALAGLRAITAALRPGVALSAVYAAWAEAVNQVHPQIGALPRHHCGYLVGIGFPPSWVGGGEVLGIRPDTDRVVRTGMTFHAMSWVQEPTGYVMSDTVAVTENGCELLTDVSREFTVVGDTQAKEATA
ncbi:M24 family metallopeptidase [Salinactinospora qingdaonensis]|uniref:Xaa-Pro peptidase family protein n=1 Tax=Salinactinospora qingdaonensis TaxID=702744 RepID=A0ABP7F1T6_9ACTN